MLRFAVFDDQGSVAEPSLAGAHLLGPDDLPVRGRIRVRNGLIECERQSTSAAGLCLQVETGRCGTLMLQTCLLPHREEPYLLSVELARHRIKQFIAKSEEWQMFDIAADHPAMVLWEQARQQFTEALVAPAMPEADAAARASLDLGIKATERLALAHAEILLHKRFGNRAASSATLGVRVWPGRDGKALRELIATNFDLVVLPLRWREIEVEEGKYRWGPVDRWMEWAHAQGKPIIAGPLLDFSRAALPEWMHVWQHDYDTCRDLAYDYMERVVSRYRMVVGMWNLAAGLNANDNFEFTPQQMLDLSRTASLLVRQARPGARTMIELRQPFGEHTAAARESMAPLAFVERLIQEGIRFDAIGVQLLFGEARQGRAVRDLMQISAMLDRFQLFDTPVLISSAGVPSQPIDETGGVWHEAWTPDLQAGWAGRLFAMGMSKPFVESIFWTDLYDHAGADLPAAGLIGEEGQPKPALARLVGARRRLRKPLGPRVAESGSSA